MQNFKNNLRYASVEHEILARLTRNWTIWDSIKSREYRDWAAFDKMDDYTKIKIRLQEAKNYGQ